MTFYRVDGFPSTGTSNGMCQITIGTFLPLWWLKYRQYQVHFPLKRNTGPTRSFETFRKNSKFSRFLSVHFQIYLLRQYLMHNIWKLAALARDSLCASSATRVGHLDRRCSWSMEVTRRNDFRHGWWTILRIWHHFLRCQATSPKHCETARSRSFHCQN